MKNTQLVQNQNNIEICRSINETSRTPYFVLNGFKPMGNRVGENVVKTILIIVTDLNTSQMTTTSWIVENNNVKQLSASICIIKLKLNESFHY